MAVWAQLPQIQTPGPATRGPRSLQPQKEQARVVPRALPMRRWRRWTGAIHSSSSFLKLGASPRSQAVARSRELGLLEG